MRYTHDDVYKPKIVAAGVLTDYLEKSFDVLQSSFYEAGIRIILAKVKAIDNALQKIGEDYYEKQDNSMFNDGNDGKRAFLYNNPEQEKAFIDYAFRILKNGIEVAGCPFDIPNRKEIRNAIKQFCIIYMARVPYFE